MRSCRKKEILLIFSHMYTKIIYNFLMLIFPFTLINFTHSRDDQEIFAGDYISKIIVPHPGLHFPKILTITYHVYRGWLSRGLNSWSVNKVILSDSFGESFSLCKLIELESGNPVRITLVNGDCREKEYYPDVPKTSTEEPTTKLSPSETPEAGATELYPNMLINKTGEVIELGKHTIIKNDSMSSVIASSSEKSISVITADSWQPIKMNSNFNESLKQSNSSSNSLDEEKFLNIGERMAKAKTEKRSFGESDENYPIRDDSTAVEEPIDDDSLKMTINELNNYEMDQTDRDDKYVTTIQLFPYRLGDIFEKAEKYAKYTLFPLLSEQISNIFNFDGGANNNGRNEKASSNAVRPQMKTTRKFDSEDDDDDASGMTNSNEKVQTLQKMTMTAMKSDNMRPPIEKLLNSNFELTENDENESVRINLPTYKPPSRESDKIFIPIDRGSV